MCSWREMIECLSRKYWTFLLQKIFARFNCEEHFLMEKAEENNQKRWREDYFSSVCWRCSTFSVCLSMLNRMKSWMELVKVASEQESLSKPLAPLISSVTISVNMCVLGTLEGELIEGSSVDDGGIEWNDRGVELWRLNAEEGSRLSTGWCSSFFSVVGTRSVHFGTDVSICLNEEKRIEGMGKEKSHSIISLSRFAMLSWSSSSIFGLDFNRLP